MSDAPAPHPIPTRRQPRPHAPAFTLIEVLIAVIIIGLGMIGISALFAGAARQQQVISQSIRSTTAARNAESKVLELFNGFRDVTDLANCKYNGVTTDVPATDRLTVEWTRIDADNDDTLTIADIPTQFDGVLACTSMYFEKPLAEFSMLDNSELIITRPAQAVDLDGFTGGVSNASALRGLNPYFPVRSLIAETLEIDVYIGGSDRVDFNDPEFDNPNETAPPPDPNLLGKTVRYTYIYDPSLPSGEPNVGEGPCSPKVIKLRPKEIHPRAQSQGWSLAEWREYDHISIESFKCPVERNTDNPEFAYIDSMKIFGVKETAKSGTLGAAPDRVGRYIQKIVVRSATHRSVNMLSASERVLSETAPSGERRDVSGLALAMRGAGPNGALVCVFSYSVQGQDGQRFIPQERANDNLVNRPIRQAAVELVYNRETESYWFFAERTPGANNTDESWLARSGQTPLFVGDQVNDITGADAPSRVVRVVTLERSGGYWCELERAPRAGTAVVGPGNPRFVNAIFSPTSSAGAAGVHRVLGVALEVAGRNADGTLQTGAAWKLTPIEARVYSVSR